MLRTLRLAARGLTRRPTFALTAVTTLAVGIGATTALFSAVSATVLNPLPYSSPQDLYLLATRFVDGRWSNGGVTQAYVADVAMAPSVVRAVWVQDNSLVVHDDEGRTRQVLSQYVAEGFFDLFGVEMAAGRSFVPEDHGSLLEPPAVISDRLWTELFGRDPSLVGRGLRMTGFTSTIVGVAPPEFDVPEDTDLWFAAPRPANPTSTSHNFQGYLRVAPGTTRERLDAELDAVMVGLVEQFPNTAGGRAFVATDLTEAIVGDVGMILVILLAGSALLLLLSCINVATLLLGRGTTRTKELAVSSAQGATRRQLAGHFVAEAFLLAAAGVVVGLGVGMAGLELLLSIGGSQLPRMSEVRVDFDVFTFAGIVLVLATLAVGLLPALLLSAPNVAGLLGEGGSRGGGRLTRRLLSGLVIAEVALGVALVSGAGWLTRSYANLANIDPGFETEGRLVFEALLAGSRYAPNPPFIETPQGLTIDPAWVPPPETPSLWLDELSDGLVGSGRVTAVGAALTIPLEREWDGGVYAAMSPEEFDRDRAETIQRRLVTPDFFDAMGITLLTGRSLAPSDDLSVAVVNEEFARRVLPGRDPIGASFFWGYPNVNFERPLRIVGVVENVRYRSLREPPGPVVYILFYPPRANVVVSTTGGDSRDLIPSIMSTTQELDPLVPIQVRRLADVVRDELLVPRLALAVSLLFAIVSLALAAIGIYGVVALSTAQRSRELATRTALGASPASLASLIVSEGQLLAVGGIVIGVGAAYLAGRIISSRLYGVEPADPVVLGSAALAVFLVTLIAHLVPALRTRGTTPATSLKVE